MGIQTAVRSNDTVAVEVIVGSGIASVVATIGKNLLACNLALIAQSLIDKVPDKATLVFRILANEVPILLEATHRVAHSVGILTLDKRTRILALGIFLAITIIVVHRTEDIGLPPVTRLLILNGARGIYRFNPVVDSLKIWSVACLVAHAPYDDTGVVAQGEHISLIALEVHLSEVRALSKCSLAIAHSMTLEISLGYQIETCRVA